MDNDKLRSETIDWLKEQNFNYIGTLVFNMKISKDGAREKLKQLHARIDRKILGRKWADKPVAERLFSVSFTENAVTNLHYHCVFRVPELRLSNFSEFVADSWKDLVPAGNADISVFDPERNWLDYITKQMGQNGQSEPFIISTEFSTK